MSKRITVGNWKEFVKNHTEYELVEPDTFLGRREGDEKVYGCTMPYTGVCLNGVDWRDCIFAKGYRLKKKKKKKKNPKYFIDVAMKFDGSFALRVGKSSITYYDVAEIANNSASITCQYEAPIVLARYNRHMHFWAVDYCGISALSKIIKECGDDIRENIRLISAENLGLVLGKSKDSIFIRDNKKILLEIGVDYFITRRRGNE